MGIIEHAILELIPICKMCSKAILLAAGLGTRLRPLTETTPKCLVPIGGKPLLAYWLELLRRHGITDVLINLHHLADQVRAFLDAQDFGLRIHLFYEETLLGSAGTLLANRQWVEQEKAFLVAYADNLTKAHLGKLIAYHHQHDLPLTMGLFETNRPRECGIAVLDAESTILAFEEKPEQPRSNLANAGIYVVSPDIFSVFDDAFPQDFGFHVLPKLVGRMKGFPLDAYLLDIGNMERYRRAQEDVRRPGWNI